MTFYSLSHTSMSAIARKMGVAMRVQGPLMAYMLVCVGDLRAPEAAAKPVRCTTPLGVRGATARSEMHSSWKEMVPEPEDTHTSTHVCIYTHTHAHMSGQSC